MCGIVGGFVNCREVSAGLSGLMQRFFEGLYRVLYVHLCVSLSSRNNNKDRSRAWSTQLLNCSGSRVCVALNR